LHERVVVEVVAIQTAASIFFSKCGQIHNAPDYLAGTPPRKACKNVLPGCPTRFYT
jgi:hypothetical protein